MADVLGEHERTVVHRGIKHNRSKCTFSLLITSFSNKPTVLLNKRLLPPEQSPLMLSMTKRKHKPRMEEPDETGQREGELFTITDLKGNREVLFHSLKEVEINIIIQGDKNRKYEI